MWEKKNIDLIYRVLCLGVFLIVILFVHSLPTLCILALFFFLVTKKENNFLFIFLYILTFIMFCLSYMSNSYFFFKLSIIIDFCFYFLNIPSIKVLVDKLVNIILNNKINDESEEIASESENDYLRFKKSLKINRKNLLNMDFGTSFYVIVHFIVAFISVVVG